MKQITNETTQTRVGMQLKVLRMQHKLTQEELAKKLKIDRGTLGRWETGRQDITLDKLSKVISFFNYSFTHFFETLNM